MAALTTQRAWKASPMAHRKIRLTMAERQARYRARHPEKVEAYKAKMRTETAARRALLPPSPREQAILEGKTRYFTGKPCLNGHIAERSVKGRQCILCLAEIKARVPKERKANYSAEWRKRNPEKAKEVLANFRAQHKAQLREQSRKRYANDPEKGRQRTKRWREKNPEGMRAHAQTRNARKNGSGGRYTAEDVRSLKIAQCNKCAYCKDRLGKRFHVDHIMPISKGGMNVRGNLQILCVSCNLSKHNADPIDFAQRRGLLL